MEIKIKKQNENVKTPTYETEAAAGADLYAYIEKDIMIKPGETKFISTGLSMEIPQGFVGLIYARSGLACKKGLAPANKVGVIDSDYRGEVMVALHNHSKYETSKICNGDRIAQIVFAPYSFAEFQEVESLKDTERGEGGFGSTGMK